ncbi:hypothetical protein Tco_0426639, partial [Tanacetum coccineum]
RAYAARPTEKREYAGTLPWCNKCNFTIIGRALPGAVQKTAGNGEAHERAYALGGGEPNPDSNIVT